MGTRTIKVDGYEIDLEYYEEFRNNMRRTLWQYMALMRTEICESCELRIDETEPVFDQTCGCATYDVLTCFIVFGETELIKNGKIALNKALPFWIDGIKPPKE